MKGAQRTRTRAQNLAEIVQKQGGFLTGLNQDSPKSDVGDTQLTVLKNAIPFRDRIDARGGLKPTTKYKEEATFDEAIFGTNVDTLYYDEDWDEIFYSDGTVKVTGTKALTYCETLHPRYLEGIKFVRANDKIIVCSGGGTVSTIIEDRGADFFIRPLYSQNSFLPVTKTPLITNSDVGTTFQYAFIYSFVRIIDGVVLFESQYYTPILKGNSVELNGTVTPYSVTTSANNKPTLHYVAGSADNLFTHIRYYRTEDLGSVALPVSENLLQYNFYRVGDAVLNGIETTPVLTSNSDLNVTDSIMVIDLATYPPLWQAGYVAMPQNSIADASNGMLLMKNEGSEINYSPIMSGDAQKYLGWYNPFYQYSKGVNGDVTMIKDVGSGCLITTANRSYYIDTASKIENEGQRALAIYTPILADVTMISKNIGVSLNQRMSVVEANEGNLIGFTSDGAIRNFANGRWGVDLTKDKMQGITVGLIKEYGLQASAVFSNDAYYLTYTVLKTTFNDSEYNKFYTLRLGTTEQSGYGFSVFTGEPDADEVALRDLLGDVAGSLAYMQEASGWPFLANEVMYDNLTPFVTIKDVLHCIRSDVDYTSAVLLEYTGDKFDKKLNKDVIDGFTGATTPVYDNTVYHDINTEIEFPEVTPESEGDFIYFLRANFYLRADRFSYKVTSETTKGYEITNTNIERVTLADTEFSMDVRSGETDEIKASNEVFEPTKAVVLNRDVQDHRIRLTLKSDVSGFQLTGMESHFKRDIRKNIGVTDTQTDIEALNTDMFIHINQNIANLCVGTDRSATFDIGSPIEGAFLKHNPEPQVEGAVPTLETDPAGDTYAVVVNSDMEFEVIEPISITACTLMLWRKAVNSIEYKFGWNSEATDLYIIEVIGTTIKFYEVIAGVKTELLTDTDATSWEHYAIVYNSGWTLYKDGVSVDTSAEGLETSVNFPSFRTNGTGTFADIRAYNKALTTDQLALYYTNFLNEDGDYTNGY